MKKWKLVPLILLLCLCRFASVQAQGEAQAYTVKKGDTFLGIALEHQLSQEQLQTANPQVDPGMILPGTQLILPPSDPAAFDDFIQKQYAEYLQINTPRCFPSAVSGTDCLLEISNPGDSTTYNIRVTLTLTDAAGKTVSAAGSPLVNQLFPGETLPLHFQTAEPLTPPIAASAAIDALQYTAEPAFSTRLADDQYSSYTSTYAADKRSAVLNVEFADNARQSEKTILAAAYNASGEPVGLRGKTLQPGEVAATFTVYTLTDPIASIKVWADAY